MSDKTVKISFQPLGKTFDAPVGISIREAAAHAGISIDYPCGGQGSCGKCRVRVLSPQSSVTSGEFMLLGMKNLDDGYRLACQAHVVTATTVEVPEESLLASDYQILTTTSVSGDEGSETNDPPVYVRVIKLSSPTLEDDASDIERIRKELGPVDVDIDLMRALPERLRNANYAGKAIVAENRLIDFIPGDDESQCLVAAFDIGTTTLVATLMDARTNTELAHTSRINPQTSFGDDILSRITYAVTNDEQLDQMRRSAIDAVNAMLNELAQKVGATVEDIYDVAFAGNTTMQHLLLGIDPTSLGMSPFVPVVSDPYIAAANLLDITIHPRGRAYVFPVIGGYVGGDTVAGLIATNLSARDKPTLFVDIGTNGEIVVTLGDRMVATSCAAGPAFEGARIKHGMRAAVGAIEIVQLGEDLSYKVIGDAAPVGLCGSALIDLVAELLQAELVTVDGTLLSREQAPDALPAALKERLQEHDGETCFLIADEKTTQTGYPIYLTQHDVRELQLATGAVRSAITIIMQRVGLKLEELDRVLVAGAFGNYIRCHNAQRIGLLPHEVAPERITFVGNATLAGTRRVLVSKAARSLALDLAHQTEHVDLSTAMDFHETFMEALFFPEPPGTKGGIRAWFDRFRTAGSESG